MPQPSPRTERAERLRGYFDLQLRFADTVATRKQIPLAEAVPYFTNLHRRFGLGDIDAQPEQALWRYYVDELSRRPTQEERVDCTQQFFIRAPEEQPPPNETPFGCFGCGSPSKAGVIRFHFANRDRDGGVSALARSKVGRRQRELREMFSFVRRTFPAARAVHGVSWLYNIEAYRRLFPSEYAESRRLPDRPLRLNGTSSWGQFLDNRRSIKPGLRDAFLENLKTLNIAAPWRAFPLPALFADAPIDLFYEYYRVDRDA